jgi:hypothetical protein
MTSRRRLATGAGAVSEPKSGERRCKPRRAGLAPSRGREAALQLTGSRARFRPADANSRHRGSSRSGLAAPGRSYERVLSNVTRTSAAATVPLMATEQVRCSFCERVRVARESVAGPGGIHICSDCVWLAADVLREAGVREPPRLSLRGRMRWRLFQWRQEKSHGAHGIEVVAPEIRRGPDRSGEA